MGVGRGGDGRVGGGGVDGDSVGWVVMGVEGWWVV